jgi:hypothetical protein
MKTTSLCFSLLVCAAAAPFGCNSNNNNNNNPSDASVDQSTADATGSSSGGEGGMIPAVPTLGTEIDRMGRAAVNTALNNEFAFVGGTPSMMTAAGMSKDRYNFDSNPSDWVANWVPTFEQSLAVYDGLDGVCGNQLGYGALGNPGYATLATVLANDMLWLNTGSATCTTYLAVEANALGVTNTDCGGRGLTYNVIDITYNALAGTLSVATLPPTGPVTNGVTAPSSPPTATFPFLASPH